MRSVDYMAVLANLDKQYQQAKTSNLRNTIDSARRHLAKIYEDEKAKAEAARKGRSY